MFQRNRNFVSRKEEPMELPKQLKAHRERLGLSQEAVAQAIYVSRQTMSSWENGKTYPDVQSLLLLSDLFGVSIDELVKGDVVSMKEVVSKDALKMERLAMGSVALLLAGIACMAGIYALLPEPSFIPHMSAGALIGILVFVAFWIPSLVCTSRIERIKREHDLVTFREISAFMDGEEAPSETDALSRRRSRLSSALKMACGAGFGFLIAFLITALVNALH